MNGLTGPGWTVVGDSHRPTWYQGSVMRSIEPTHRTAAANALRALAIDATNAAKSGHPGAPMGLADIAVVLFGEVMRFDPAAPDWVDRDRFILSNGHASMLLYGLLHLAGYPLPLDELRRFRQLGSKTAGHPEYGLAPGIETTTGPLGQGFANGVGMALSARMLKARFNGHGFDPIAHRIFGILGDGCVMEGITGEAASLAGHLGLGELVFVYDDNGITIDGGTDIAMSEDVEGRYRAYGWHTARVDGHDPTAVRDALLAGCAEPRPTLILARTHIGYGSPNRQDTAQAHGEPLGADEARQAKEKLGWSHGPFEIPEEARTVFAAAAARGAASRQAWDGRFADWRRANPDLAQTWDAHFGGRRIPQDAWRDVADRLKEKGRDATRNLSGAAINALASRAPALVGGSADLTGSTKNTIQDSSAVGPGDFFGRNLHFGVREHAMAAVVNGMALSGALVPFGATFLVFSDYMRPSLRLSALMKVRALQVFTHDSIGLGEDGPTHQPVEHLWALRMIPDLYVWRPADGLETAMAWCYAAGEGPERPHALVFTRQKVAPLPREPDFDPRTIWRGAYVVAAPEDARAAFVATGSEVELALAAARQLAQEGLPMRVVSMPCVDRFLELDRAEQDAVLPPSLPVVSIEAGRTPPWKIITGRDGLNLGVDTFGESGPHEEVYAHFGLTPEKIADRVRRWHRALTGA